MAQLRGRGKALREVMLGLRSNDSVKGAAFQIDEWELGSRVSTAEHGMNERNTAEAWTVVTLTPQATGWSNGLHAGLRTAGNHSRC